MKYRKFQCDQGHTWESIIILLDDSKLERPPACPMCLIRSGVDNRGNEIEEAVGN